MVPRPERTPHISRPSSSSSRYSKPPHSASTGLPLNVTISRPSILYRDSRTGLYYTAPVLVDGADARGARSRVLRYKLGDDLMSAIGGAALHDDNFLIDARQRLRPYALQERRHGIRLVVSGDDDGYFHCFTRRFSARCARSSWTGTARRTTTAPRAAPA